MIFSKLNEIFQDKWNKIECLDIGCSEGHSSFELAKKGVKKVVGFDADKKILKKHFL